MPREGARSYAGAVTTPSEPPQQPPVPPAQPPFGAPQGQPSYGPPQPGAPQYGAPQYAAPQPMNPADEKLWATLVHVGGIFFSFLPALIGYLVLKDRGPFVRAHTATALNFQLTLLIAYLVGTITSILIIGIFILIAAGILAIVFSIIAAVKANRGEWYSYPLTIKFLS